MRKVVRKINRNNSSKSSKLCSFGYLDYMILASTISIALSEEFDDDEISVLASFFAVLSDELALIEAIKDCNDNTPDEDTFVAPIPSVATTLCNDHNNIAKNTNSNIKRKKVIRKKKIKRRNL